MKTPKPKQKRKRRIPERDRKQRQIVVRVTEAEYNALEQIAESEGLTMGYFVREAISLLIKKHQPGSKQKEIVRVLVEIGDSPILSSCSNCLLI